MLIMPRGLTFGEWPLPGFVNAPGSLRGPITLGIHGVWAALLGLWGDGFVFGNSNLNGARHR